MFSAIEINISGGPVYLLPKLQYVNFFLFSETSVKRRQNYESFLNF